MEVNGQPVVAGLVDRVNQYEKELSTSRADVDVENALQGSSQARDLHCVTSGSRSLSVVADSPYNSRATTPYNSRATTPSSSS